MKTERTDFAPAIAPRPQGDWDLRGTANFMFGGTGCGLMIVAGLSGPVGLEPRWPVLVALVLIALGLLSVLAKIGRPLRAMNVLFNPRTSWMSREAVAAIPLFALGLGAAWLNSPALALGAAAVALFYLYCQAKILQSCKGVPAWRAPLVAPLIMASGLAEGAGLTGMFIIVGRIETTPEFGLITLPGMLILTFGLLMRYLAWIKYLAWLEQTGAPLESLNILRAENRHFGLLGHLVPVLILGLGLFLITFPMALTIGGLWALHSGWRIKIILINRAGHTQGLGLPFAPARGGGKPGPGGKPGWQMPASS